MYHNGVTIWRKTSQDSTFKATYALFQVDEVHLESTQGYRRATQGESSADKYVIIAPVDAFKEGDLVADGIYTCSEPVEDAKRVSAVARYDLHGTLHHVEVTLS